MKKILIVNLGGIGDILLSQPALVALRNKFPDAQIDFLAAKKANAYLDMLGVLDTRYYIDIKYRKSVFTKIIRIAYQLLRLRRQKYDVLINMRTIYSKDSAKKIKLIIDLIAAKSTYGRNTEGWADFFTYSIAEGKIGTKHESEYDFETVALLGAEVQKKWSLDLDVSDKSRIYSKFFEENADRVVIVWHVGGMPSRRIPEVLMSEILDSLAKRPEFRVYFLGSDEELASVKDYKDVVKVANLSFMELCAFISNADIFVSNDTGPMHIAAVLKKRMISFFGPGDLKRYDPRAINENAIVFGGGAACSPCEKLHCRNRICFSGIKISDVVKAIA